MGGWGHLVGWNGAGGSTASEYAQGRIDSFNAELRRPARKIHVMSEEAWARKAEKAKKEHEEKEAKLEKERKEKKLAKEQALVPFQERVERDKKFSSLIKDKLLLYHEPAGEEQYDEKKWEPVYTQVSPFLAKVVLAYRYTVARDSGKLAGKDLDYCGGWNLESYLDSRGLALSDDEKGFFKDLLSNKLDWPGFFALALSGRIEALGDLNSLDESVDLLGFILEDQVTQIEINELILE